MFISASMRLVRTRCGPSNSRGRDRARAERPSRERTRYRSASNSTASPRRLEAARSRPHSSGADKDARCDGGPIPSSFSLGRSARARSRPRLLLGPHRVVPTFISFRRDNITRLQQLADVLQHLVLVPLLRVRIKSSFAMPSLLERILKCLCVLIAHCCGVMRSAPPNPQPSPACSSVPSEETSSPHSR